MGEDEEERRRRTAVLFFFYKKGKIRIAFIFSLFNRVVNCILTDHRKYGTMSLQGDRGPCKVDLLSVLIWGNDELRMKGSEGQSHLVSTNCCSVLTNYCLCPDFHCDADTIITP